MADEEKEENLNPYITYVCEICEGTFPVGQGHSCTGNDEREGESEDG